jgi:hypothetical protein
MRKVQLREVREHSHNTPRKCVESGLHSGGLDFRAWDLNCHMFLKNVYIYREYLHILWCVVHLEEFLEIVTNRNRPENEHQCLSAQKTWLSGGSAVSTNWVHLIQWNLPGEPLGSAIDSPTLCSPPLIVICLHQDSMLQISKRRLQNPVSCFCPLAPPSHIKADCKERFCSDQGLKCHHGAVLGPTWSCSLLPKASSPCQTLGHGKTMICCDYWFI